MAGDAGPVGDVGAGGLVSSIPTLSTMTEHDESVEVHLNDYTGQDQGCGGDSDRDGPSSSDRGGQSPAGDEGAEPTPTMDTADSIIIQAESQKLMMRSTSEILKLAGNVLDKSKSRERVEDVVRTRRGSSPPPPLSSPPPPPPPPPPQSRSPPPPSLAKGGLRLPTPPMTPASTPRGNRVGLKGGNPRSLSPTSHGVGGGGDSSSPNLSARSSPVTTGTGTRTISMDNAMQHIPGKLSGVSTMTNGGLLNVDRVLDKLDGVEKSPKRKQPKPTANGGKFPRDSLELPHLPPPASRIRSSSNGSLQGAWQNNSSSSLASFASMTLDPTVAATMAAAERTSTTSIVGASSKFGLMPEWIGRVFDSSTGGELRQSGGGARGSGGISASVVGGENGAGPAHAAVVDVDENDVGDDANQGGGGGGIYRHGTSRTLVRHEISRGDWTWCIEWSPDGKRLALATENHHLAIVDVTTAGGVWKVMHDKRIREKVQNDTTHTVRSIAWGSSYIAIGGTGDAVSIIDPNAPGGDYPIIDVITGTGFVGSLNWRANSSVLAIGNREDQCLIVDVAAAKDDVVVVEAGTNGTVAAAAATPGGALGKPKRKKVTTSILHNIERTHWVNTVAFSPGGMKLAIGDQSGALSIFVYVSLPNTPAALSPLRDFQLDDSILDVRWSPDGSWLYVGGEDYAVTVIDASKWDVVYRIERERWVPFLAPSHGGTHVAMGGAESAVTLYGVVDYTGDGRGGGGEGGVVWEPAASLEFGSERKAIPLFARWHPKDHYLAIAGQDNSVYAYETTGMRYAEGKYLRSKTPIVAVEFSPNGKTLAVGNEEGIVSFFDASAPAFTTIYETVLGGGGSVSIGWSPNGRFVAVGSGHTLVVLDTLFSSRGGRRPTSASRFSVRKVLQGTRCSECVSFSPDSDLLAVTGETTRILDMNAGLDCIRELKQEGVLSSSWSPDGTLFSMVDQEHNLTIYDARGVSVNAWRVIFSLKCNEAGKALAWGPSVRVGLQYLAYGGEDSKVTILEIRTFEETWETVVQVPREAKILDLDWNNDGMLAIADEGGTATVVDLAYLKSGKAVNEMNYNWQRQGMTGFTELKRGQGKNAMTALRWMPSHSVHDRSVHDHRNMLAIAGTDGVVEIIDLTER